MTMMPLVYFMMLPSYVDRRRSLPLEKSLHFLCITVYVHSNIFTIAITCTFVLSLYKFFIGILYNLNGPVVIALPLVSKSDAHSSIHIRILKKI